MSAPYFVLNDGTDRASWLADRERGVSATDAARLMTSGSHGWAALHAEKLGGSTFGGNKYTRYGREREAVIAAYAAATFGLEPSTALLARFAEGGADLAFGLDLATPDAIAADEFGEFKTTVHDWPTWADVPRRYHWQVVWQFHVTGAARCRFVFEPHEEFVPIYAEPRTFTIERADVEADLELALKTVADWRAADFAAIPEGLEELDGMLRDRQVVKEAHDAATARLTAADDAIRALLEQHGRLDKPFEGTGSTVAWTGQPVKSRRFDAKALQAADPDTHAKYLKTTEARPRLTITDRK